MLFGCLAALSFALRASLVIYASISLRWHFALRMTGGPFRTG